MVQPATRRPGSQSQQKAWQQSAGLVPNFCAPGHGQLRCCFCLRGQVNAFSKSAFRLIDRARLGCGQHLRAWHVKRVSWHDRPCHDVQLTKWLKFNADFCDVIEAIGVGTIPTFAVNETCCSVTTVRHAQPPQPL